MAENPLVTLARVLGGVVLTQGNLGHQVLGQLLIMNTNEVAMAAAAAVVAGTSGQRSAVGQIALRTVAPALAVRVLLNKQEERLERKTLRLAERERALIKRRIRLRRKRRRLDAEMAELLDRLAAPQPASPPAVPHTMRFVHPMGSPGRPEPPVVPTPPGVPSTPVPAPLSAGALASGPSLPVASLPALPPGPARGVLPASPPVPPEKTAPGHRPESAPAPPPAPPAAKAGPKSARARKASAPSSKPPAPKPPVSKRRASKPPSSKPRAPKPRAPKPARKPSKRSLKRGRKMR